MLSVTISEGTSSDCLQNKIPCSLAIDITAGNAINKKGGRGASKRLPRK